MVKMVQGDSNTQASTASSTMASRMSAYELTLSALSSFSNANDLSGDAYRSAKMYAEAVITPLLQGAIMLSEALSTGAGKLPTEYANHAIFEGKDLDSDTLTEELNSLDMSIVALENALVPLRGKKGKASQKRSIENQLQEAIQRREKILQQLKELDEYNTASASFFDHYETLEAQVLSGLDCLTDQMVNFSGEFTIPTESGQMDWAKTIQTRWESRQEALSALESKDPLKGKNIQRVVSYLKMTGETESEILLYDDYYGYGKFSLSVNPEVNDVTVSKSMFDQASATVQGSAVEEVGISNSSTVSLNKKGEVGAAYNFTSGNNSTEIGTKVVNGTMAAYNATTATASIPVTKSPDTSGSISATYEQGKYIRPNDHKRVDSKGFDWGKVGDVAEEVGEFAQEHPVLTGLAVVGVIGAGAWIAGGGVAVASATGAMNGLTVAGGAVSTTLSMVFLGDEKNDKK